MKLVMTLLVRDEEDIIRENIDFHLNQGVDFIIATDNKSKDSTKDILKEYENIGKLCYLYENEDTHNQGEWVTKMARMAFNDYNADWIINNDADEFWWPSQHRSIKEALLSLPKGCNIIEAKRNNFIFLKSPQKEKFYENMIYKERISLNSRGNPLPSKQAHKGSSSAIVTDGNHKILGLDSPSIQRNIIEIFHFPLRNTQQFLNKIAHGGAALQRNTQLPKSTGNTWRHLYKDLVKSGNLDSYFIENLYNHEDISRGLDNGSLIKDRRLQTYLTEIYK